MIRLSIPVTHVELIDMYPARATKRTVHTESFGCGVGNCKAYTSTVIAVFVLWYTGSARVSEFSYLLFSFTLALPKEIAWSLLTTTNYQNTYHTQA